MRSTDSSLKLCYTGSVGKKAKRSRSRKELERRGAEKELRDRQRLANLERGGSALRPIEVATPSVIETRAAAAPCPLCSGAMDVLDHSAVTHPEPLRKLLCRCRQCHREQTRWYRIVAPAQN